MNVKPITYPEVKPGRYFISDEGDVFRLECGRIDKLKGCKPDNEKGYIRVSLATDYGGVKKFPVHRLVMYEFVGPSDLEVNHKDGKKTNNKLNNLEYVTPDENKRHAALNRLYKSCEDAPNARLTNAQVHDICRLFEKDYNIRKIIRKLGLPESPQMYTILQEIVQRRTWNWISKDYNWDLDEIRLKVYKHKDLIIIARLIKTGKYKSKEIARKFKKYNEKQLIQVIKKMRQGKLYKSIMKEAECSTTIADPDGLTRDSDGFIVLSRKSA